MVDDVSFMRDTTVLFTRYLYLTMETILSSNFEFQGMKFERDIAVFIFIGTFPTYENPYHFQINISRFVSKSLPRAIS